MLPRKILAVVVALVSAFAAEAREPDRAALAARFDALAEGFMTAQQVPGAWVPILPEPEALKLLEALRQTGEGQGEVLTVTLSLPRGRTLDRAGWRGAIGVLWDALGLPGEAMPWEAWRHDNTPTSQIRILARSILP